MHDDDETVREAVGHTHRLLKRWWIICGAVVVLVLVVAGGSFLVSNIKGGDTKTIDRAYMESQIKHWAVKKAHGYQLITVKCPSDVPIKAGDTFHCIVSDAEHNKVRLAVTIENDKGDVTWMEG